MARAIEKNRRSAGDVGSMDGDSGVNAKTAYEFFRF
jgi:hypothetical protein